MKHCSKQLSLPAVSHPFELVCDKDCQGLLVETMPLLYYKGAVKAEGDAQQHILPSIQKIVDDRDQDFMRFIIAKMRSHRY